MEENQIDPENQTETNEETTIQTNDDTVINTDSSSDNETVESTKPTKTTKTAKPSKPIKPKKSPKSQFKEDCNHCSKSFKTKLTYDKHVLQQLCYKQDEITYCKICNITLTNHNQYKKHLFTMEHLNNIGYNSIERLQNKEVSKVHLADPYLNTNDVNKIANTNLGDSFTFVFNIGNTKTVSLVNANNNQIQNQTQPQLQNQTQLQTNPQLQTPITNVNQDTTTPDTTPSTTPSTTSATILNNIINTEKEPTHQEPTHQEPTQRQQKIISYLEKQSIENTNPSDSGKRFYKMLDNSLQLEDYKGLQNIISNINIPFVFKDTYLKVVEIFITMLVKEKTKGEKLYKDKEISQLVINLTS